MSPGETSATLTTVPVAGAYRRVSFSAFSAFLTVAWAPSTAAWAEAMLAAIVSALVVLVCPEVDPPLPDPLRELDPFEEDVRLGVVLVVRVGVVVVRVGVVCVGVVVVRVRVGDVVVRVVVVVVGVVLVDVVVVCVAVVSAGWKVTNSVDSGAFVEARAGGRSRRRGLVLSVGEVVLRRGEVRLRLLDGQLGGGRVQRGDELALDDVVAVLDVEVLQRATRLEVGLHVGPRLHVSGARDGRLHDAPGSADDLAWTCVP